MTARRKRVTPEPLLSEKVDFVTFLKMWNVTRNQKTPEHHLRIARWLIDHKDHPEKLLMAFRDGAKSFMICMWIAWCLYTDPTQTFMVVSAVDTLATKNSKMIKEVISNHPLTEHLVPTADSDLWRTNQFNINRPPGIQEYSVMALPLGGDATGQHSHHVVIDDSETQRNSETQESRDRLKERLEEMQSVARRTITWIGTPHGGEDSIYVRMLNAPEEFVPLVIPVYTEDENGVRTYTWPEQVGPEKCARAESKNLTRFRTQYLLEIISSNDSGLPLDLVPIYDADIRRTESFNAWGDINQVKAAITTNVDEKPTTFEIIDMLGAWDPAAGTNDASVLAIVARSKCNKTFIHRTIELPKINREGWRPQHDVIMTTLKRYGIGKLYVETNQNRAIVAETRMAAERHKVSSLQVIGIHNTVSKEQRIKLQLEAAISAGRLWVCSEALKTPFAQQCRDFPMNMKGKRYNDFIDAAAFGIEYLRHLPPGYVANTNLYWSRNRQVTPMRAGSAGGNVIDRSRSDRWA